MCFTSLIGWEFAHDRNGGGPGEIPYFSNLGFNVKDFVVQRLEERCDRAEIRSNLCLLLLG